MNEVIETVEERIYTADVTIEQRAEGDNPGVYFTGVGIVFNQPSRALYDPKKGNFIEVIEPGAVDEKTDVSEVLAVFNHDENRLLGTNHAGTLTFETTKTGVSVRILKPNTTVGNDCEEYVRRGDIRGMSFKFKVGKDRWEYKDNILYRFVEKISVLLDLSLVTRAAYLQTSINMAEETQKRSHSESVEETISRAFAASGKEKPKLSDTDQKFLTDLVTQLKTQIDFIAGAVPNLKDSRITRLAAGRLSDLLYSKSWMEEVLAEMAAPAETETPETLTDANRSVSETPEQPQTRSADSDTNTNTQSDEDPLAWFRAKNSTHRNSLNLC